MFAVIKRKTIITCVSAFVALAILVPLTVYSGSYAVYVGKTTRKLPIYNVDREDNLVALSFDASWGCESTEKILAILKDYNVKANFFVVSLWAEKYPELLKKISDSGVFEIGLHSATHPHMSKLGKSQMREEISSNMATVERIIGIKPTLFRAPFGEYSDSVIETASELGLYTIQWDVDSLDWKGISASEIANRVIGRAKSGSIVLMHNDGKHTAEALPLIIEGLVNKGLKFVTISDLIYHDEFTIDHTGKQIKTKNKE